MIKLPTDDMVEAARFTLSGICGFEVTAQTVRKALESALAVAPMPAEHVAGGSFIKSLSPEQRRIHEALCDSQYIAGAKAGWNAGCIADPDEAQAQFSALIKSREGHLEGYADARAALSSPMGGGE